MLPINAIDFVAVEFRLLLCPNLMVSKQINDAANQQESNSARMHLMHRKLEDQWQQSLREGCSVDVIGGCFG